MKLISSDIPLGAAAEAPAQPEPFAREAKFLSETKALARDVRVILEGVDRNGALLGQVNISFRDDLPLQEWSIMLDRKVRVVNNARQRIRGKL